MSNLEEPGINSGKGKLLLVRVTINKDAFRSTAHPVQQYQRLSIPGTLHLRRAHLYSLIRDLHHCHTPQKTSDDL